MVKEKQYKYSWYDVTRMEFYSNPNVFYTTTNDAIFGDEPTED